MEVDIRKEVIDFIVRSKVFNECAVIDGIIYDYYEDLDTIRAVALESKSLDENRTLVFHDFCDEIVLNDDVKCWLYACKYALEVDNNLLDYLINWLNL